MENFRQFTWSRSTLTELRRNWPFLILIHKLIFKLLEIVIITCTADQMIKERVQIQWHCQRIPFLCTMERLKCPRILFSKQLGLSIHATFAIVICDCRMFDVLEDNSIRREDEAKLKHKRDLKSIGPLRRYLILAAFIGKDRRQWIPKSPWSATRSIDAAFCQCHWFSTRLTDSCKYSRRDADCCEWLCWELCKNFDIWRDRFS